MHGKETSIYEFYGCQSGQFQVMDQGAMTPESMVLYQVENHGAPIMSFDLSTTCDAMAFGDSTGMDISYINVCNYQTHLSNVLL